MNIVLGIIRIIIIDYKFNIVYIKTSGGYISGNENGSRAFPRNYKQIYFKISGDKCIIFTENLINYLPEFTKDPIAFLLLFVSMNTHSWIAKI